MPSLPRRDNPLGLRIFDSERHLEGQQTFDPLEMNPLEVEPTDADLEAIEASCIAGRIDPLDPVAGEPVRICVGAGEVFELLRDAISTNRAWLEDFKDDTIEIPQDMYEILVAYKDLVYRRAA